MAASLNIRMPPVNTSPTSCLCFSSDNWLPSGLGSQQQAAVPAHWHLILYSSLYPAHTFINSLFIKLSSNFPIWVGHLFCYWIKWDWIRMTVTQRVQILKWDTDLGKNHIMGLVLPGVMGWIINPKDVWYYSPEPVTMLPYVLKETFTI